MDRKQKYHAKESQLNAATTRMEEAVAFVKSLTKSIKAGTVSKKELEEAVNDLKNKARRVELLSAESKMLGGFSATKEYLPNEKKGLNSIWVLAVIAAFFILFIK